MKRLKWRIIFSLLGGCLGWVVGQLVLMLLETSGGVLLARDIVGCNIGGPFLGALLGYTISLNME